MPFKTTAATPTKRSVAIHGYALRVIREARGRKVAELAATLGCDRSYIARIETGHARRVSPAFYASLLDELQVDDYRALLAVAPDRDEAAA